MLVTMSAAAVFRTLTLNMRFFWRLTVAWLIVNTMDIVTTVIATSFYDAREINPFINAFGIYWKVFVPIIVLILLLSFSKTRILRVCTVLMGIVVTWNLTIISVGVLRQQ